MKFSLFLLLFITFTVVKAQDTSETAQFLNVTRYRLKPLELGLHKDINSDKVYLKIYKNTKGSIVEDYKFFKPKKNEILFFYGVNNETKKTEMFFKIHTNLKGAYKEKEFEKLMKIIEILQYNIFYKDNFSSADAYAALERT
ncbi:MAG: hypothetical protein JXK08_00180 [Flavobacteriaceae bacterium]|nr:hypothetical protein [Flavobacteriaceae bacterium]